MPSTPRYWLWGRDTWEAIRTRLTNNEQQYAALIITLFGQPLPGPRARPPGARVLTMSFAQVCAELEQLAHSSGNAAVTGILELAGLIPAKPMWEKYWRLFAAERDAESLPDDGWGETETERIAWRTLLNAVAS